MGRAKTRHSFATAAPGSLDNLPRSFSAFDLPEWFRQPVAFRLDITGKPNGVVELSSKAKGPSKAKSAGPTTTGRVIRLLNGAAVEVDNGPESSASLWLCGDRDAGRLFKAFFAGSTTLGIIADWIEDDIADRVKDVRHHWLTAHHLDADPVTHFLTLMRCYRDGRKVKATTRAEGG